MNIKTNKGITLIALVITIIVMLLMASVAIQMSLGKDGQKQIRRELSKQEQNF